MYILRWSFLEFAPQEEFLAHYSTFESTLRNEDLACLTDNWNKCFDLDFTLAQLKMLKNNRINTFPDPQIRHNVTALPR